MTNTAEKLIKVLSSTTRRELTLAQVENANLIETLGLSSVDALEILVGVEGEFGIEIHDSDLSIDLVSSFAVLEKYVSKQVADKGVETLPRNS